MSNYSKQYPTIQSLFKEGVETIFGTLFTDSIQLFLLDSVNTVPNIYQEAPTKAYFDPISLVAGVRLNVNISSNPVSVVEKDMVVKIPTKQLILKNISYSTEEDLEELRKAKFTYKGTDYFIDNVRPTTFIADMWHIYAFDCSKAVNEEVI